MNFFVHIAGWRIRNLLTFFLSILALFLSLIRSLRSHALCFMNKHCSKNNKIVYMCFCNHTVFKQVFLLYQLLITNVVIYFNSHQYSLTNRCIGKEMSCQNFSLMFSNYYLILLSCTLPVYKAKNHIIFMKEWKTRLHSLNN